MNWIIVMILALALSVPVGAATMTFGGLVLEFILGLLVEAGEKVESDPVKKRIAVIVLLAVLGGVLLCLCVACVAIALLLASRSHPGLLS